MHFQPLITSVFLYSLASILSSEAEDVQETGNREQKNQYSADPYDQIKDETHNEEGEVAATDFRMPDAPADVAAPPADAVKTESGLAFKILTPGIGGEKPGPDDIAEVHFTGWTTDGEAFDSSYGNGEPLVFTINEMIAGWVEGLQQMSVGEECRFWIPADLAFGDEPEDGEPAGMLVFDIELLDFEAPFAPPVEALKTKSGLAYQIERAGEGNRPSPKDNVTFHFVGKTPSGMTLEDTRKDGSPHFSYLPNVPLETREILSEMKPGELRTVWIPNPQIIDGYLVSEIELLATEPAPKIPDAPENLTQIPPKAQTTASGLASIVLSDGTGGDFPEATSTVTAHYIVWKADGGLVDTSLTTGKAATFPLDVLPAGMREGVQLMVAGEKRRFWIPEELAYGPEEQGSDVPGGELVCEIELVNFK